MEIGGPAFTHNVLGKKALSDSTKVLSNFLKRDKEKLAIEKAKNDLESYIYAMQEKLSTNEEFQKVAPKMATILNCTNCSVPGIQTLLQAKSTHHN